MHKTYLSALMLCALISSPALAAAASPATGTAGMAAIAPTPQAKPVRLSPCNNYAVEVYFDNGQMYTLDFYGEHIVRLFQDNNGGIVRPPKAEPEAEILVKNPRRTGFRLQLKTTDAEYIVSTPSMDVRIDRATGLLHITQDGREVVRQTAPIAIDNAKAALTLACHDSEYFYGGGVQNGRFSHRGQSIAIENTNNWVDGGVASPTPFYWSTAGYGLMWHTFKPGRYDFGAANPNEVQLFHSEDYLDVFLMVDKEPTALLRDFYQLTGNPVLLPKFGFYEGHLNAYNRDYWTPAAEGKTGFMAYEDGKTYNESQKDNGGVRESLNGELPGAYGHQTNYQWSARAAIDRYLDNDMPLGWFLPNDGYGAGYGQTTSLDGNIQNLKAFGDYARSKGVEIGLWTQSDLHPKEGIAPLLQRDIVKEVRDAGVRVLKTDVAWVGWGYSFGLNGVADVGEIMPYYGRNARPFIISLDGWAGTQRYAGIWSGDQTGGDWEYIRFHIPTFIGSGLSGQPNITSDVDGIFGGKNVPVNVREFQWKTYTPMELNMDGWGANPKYPHVLGDKATSLNRWYLKAKSMLLPYQYSIAREAVDGKPMVRAMFLEYPNAYTLGKQTQYQFLFGPSLLVAPVYRNTAMDNEGNDIRDGIYLPEGTWYDYFTGERYEGNRIINNFDTPLWKIPLFAKAGAIIPFTLSNNNPAAIDHAFRGYEIWPGGESSFHEYDDDGATQAYLEGESTLTPVTCRQQGDKVTVSIDRTTGSFEGFQPLKRTHLSIRATKAPKKVQVRVNGKKVQAAWKFVEKGEWVNAAATSTTEMPTQPAHIEVDIPETDVTQATVEVNVTGWENAPADPLLRSHGPLAAPAFDVQNAKAGAYELLPAWTKVENADYYEVEYNGMRYSTIRNCSLNFDDLQPKTDYHFKVRAVNADGAGEWTTFDFATITDPLEWAIPNLTATTSCKNQGGQGISKLFDRDEKSTWHTDWANNPKAVPFDLTVDLRSVNKLDRIEYIPREDAGNGTLLRGTVAFSEDRTHWTEPQEFEWAKDGSTKTINLIGGSLRQGPIATADYRPDLAPEARYVKFHITDAVGGFGSGQEMYVFRQTGTTGSFQGDINRDGRIDENDLTSYMNYTGLRAKDGDFDYVSIGDINGNGLIDAYDISCVSVELDGGVRHDNSHVEGSLTLTATKDGKALTPAKDGTIRLTAGEEFEILVSGKDLKHVNALSFALPYDAATVEYSGIELLGMKDMVNLTYDRLHSDKTKALYPTFVNRGNNFLLDEGAPELFRLRFRALKACSFNMKALDGLLVDRNLGTATF